MFSEVSLYGQVTNTSLRALGSTTHMVLNESQRNVIIQNGDYLLNRYLLLYGVTIHVPDYLTQFKNLCFPTLSSSSIQLWSSF